MGVDCHLKKKTLSLKMSMPSLMKEKIKGPDHERVMKVSPGSIISKRRLNTRAVTLAYQIPSTLLQRNLQENQRHLDIKQKVNQVNDGTKVKLRSRTLLKMTATVNGDKDNQSEDSDQWNQLSLTLVPSLTWFTF